LAQAVDEAAVKEVIAWQVAEEMKGRSFMETSLATAMHTSRS